MKRIYIIFICLTICFVNISLVFAKSTSELEAEKQQNDIKSDELKQELEVTEEEKVKVSTEINEIDTELNKATDELYAINDELEAITKELNETQIALEEAIAKRNEEIMLYEDRLRYMYIYGKKGYLEILLDAESLSDFFSRIEYMRRVVAYDQELINQMTQTQTDIENAEQIIIEDKAKIELLYVEQEAKTKELEAKLTQKQEIMAQLNSEEATYNAQIAAIEQSNKEIEQLILTNKYGSTGPYTGGKLLWPVPGHTKISSGYEYRTSPISGGGEFHTGLDIPAPLGTPVLAAEGGTVIFAGVKNGYGNCIIIDHGGGLSTLYGHLSKIEVTTGEKVEQGQEIGKVGSTGNSTGNHLHFQVQINGKHTDPLPYLQ